MMMHERRWYKWSYTKSRCERGNSMMTHHSMTTSTISSASALSGIIGIKTTSKTIQNWSAHHTTTTFTLSHTPRVWVSSETEQKWAWSHSMCWHAMMIVTMFMFVDIISRSECARSKESSWVLSPLAFLGLRNVKSGQALPRTSASSHVRHFPKRMVEGTCPVERESSCVHLGHSPVEVVWHIPISDNRVETSHIPVPECWSTLSRSTFRTSINFWSINWNLRLSHSSWFSRRLRKENGWPWFGDWHSGWFCLSFCNWGGTRDWSRTCNWGRTRDWSRTCNWNRARDWWESLSYRLGRSRHGSYRERSGFYFSVCRANFTMNKGAECNGINK